VGIPVFLANHYLSFLSGSGRIGVGRFWINPVLEFMDRTTLGWESRPDPGFAFRSCILDRFDMGIRA
jgi:hypothetical protein